MGFTVVVLVVVVLMVATPHPDLPPPPLQRAVELPLLHDPQGCGLKFLRAAGAVVLQVPLPTPNNRILKP